MKWLIWITLSLLLGYVALRAVVAWQLHRALADKGMGPGWIGVFKSDGIAADLQKIRILEGEDA